MNTFDEDRLHRLAEMMAETPLTIEQICGRMGISQRTAYRWIDELERRGCEIVRRRAKPQQGGGFAFQIEA